MKRILSYCLVALMVIGMFACNKSKKDLIVGKWSISELDPGMEIPAERKADFEAMKKSAYFDFKKDGSMEMSMNGNVQKGTWKLSDDGKKFISSQDGSTASDTLNITELNENKLSFTLETKRQKISYKLVK